MEIDDAQPRGFSPRQRVSSRHHRGAFRKLAFYLPLYLFGLNSLAVSGMLAVNLSRRSRGMPMRRLPETSSGAFR